MSRLVSIAAIPALLVTLGCPPPAVTPDAGTGPDPVPRPDAGEDEEDAGPTPEDAGPTPEDAGPTDTPWAGDGQGGTRWNVMPDGCDSAEAGPEDRPQ